MLTHYEVHAQKLAWNQQHRKERQANEQTLDRPWWGIKLGKMLNVFSKETS